MTEEPVVRFKWTPEHDKILIDGARRRMSSSGVAAIIGVTKDSVKKRANRLGVKFGRWGCQVRGIGTEGHVAADKRSRELLRAVGVDI